MDQQASGIVGFREVDREGNPAPPELEGQEEAARPWLAPNPFIVALWLLAAGMIAIAMWTLLRGPVATGPISNGLSFDFVLFTFAPHLMLIGLSAVVILLLWHAWRWQRRRG